MDSEMLQKLVLVHMPYGKYKGRLIADLITGRSPEISTDGLALDRYTHRPARHLGGSSTPVSA